MLLKIHPIHNVNDFTLSNFRPHTHRMAEVLSQPPVQLPEALAPPVLVSSDSERSASSSPEPAPSSPEPAEKAVSPTQVTLDILPTTPDGKTGGTGTGTDSGYVLCE